MRDWCWLYWFGIRWRRVHCVTAFTFRKFTRRHRANAMNGHNVIANGRIQQCPVYAEFHIILLVDMRFILINFQPSCICLVAGTQFALNMLKMYADHLIIWFSRRFRFMHRILILSLISIARQMVMATVTKFRITFDKIWCTFILLYYSRCQKINF